MTRTDAAEAIDAGRRALIEGVREVRDFPSPGVIFKDITPVLASANSFNAVVAALAAPFRGRVDEVAAIEARGFIIGAPVALALGAGFVPLRKVGKLPAATVTADYELEYGVAKLEMHADALRPGACVLIVDDVVATGGTALAAVELIRGVGATTVGLAALLEIAALGGRARLHDLELHVVATA